MDKFTTRKKYLLTINRDERAKRLVFQLNLYKWRANPKTQRRFLKNPFVSFFMEMARMGEKSAEYEPFRLWRALGEDHSPELPAQVSTTSQIKFYDTRTVKDLVLGAEEVIFDEEIAPDHEAMFDDLFSRYQVERAPVHAQFCTYCAREGRFTLLPPGQVFRSYNDQKTCKRCAGRVLLKELKTYTKVSKKLKGLLRNLLLKFKDVERIASMFSPKFNPAKRTELTLYDKILPGPRERERKPRRVRDLPFGRPFRELLVDRGITALTPVQALAIDQGLLDGRDMLVVSATSSGKTLVGELAAIPKLTWWRGRKRKKKSKGKGTTKGKRPTRATFVYLAPLVALANQRYEEYKRKYRPLGLTTTLKVGVSRVGGRKPERGPRHGADILVGTYEAIDYQLLRRNFAFLGDPATIVVDEIQMLGDPDRGFVLDGLLARLKVAFPGAQFLFLSATVANPKQLAAELNAQLVEYTGRPVPLERHLVICTNDHEKARMMGLLVDNEWIKKSKTGFRGQTIIFTYSRKRCHELARSLSSQGLKVAAYHAGLTAMDRRRVEARFNAQAIAAVVTTAALGAGVDFPASQVIFASLTMGLNWLSVAEFDQMGGRAGRLGRHARGKIVVMAEPDRTYNPGQVETEEKVALRLLGGKMQPLGLEPDEDRASRELLAFLAMASPVDLEAVYQFRGHLMNPDFKTRQKLREFQALELVKSRRTADGERLTVTRLGVAVALSFFTVTRCFELLERIAGFPRDDELEIKALVVDLAPLKNVYLTNRVVRELARQSRRRTASNHFFSQAGKAYQDANSIQKRKRLKGWIMQLYLRWIEDIFTCTCEEKPDCNCGRVNLEILILDRKLRGASLDQILHWLRHDYEIRVYYGDLLDYFDGLVHSINAISRIAAETSQRWICEVLARYLKRIEQ